MESERKQPTVLESLFYQVDELRSVASSLSKLAEHQLSSQGEDSGNTSQESKNESERRPGWPLTPPEHCNQLAVELKSIASTFSEIISTRVSPLFSSGAAVGESHSTAPAGKSNVGSLITTLQGATSVEASPLPAHHSVPHNPLGFRPAGVGMMPSQPQGQQVNMGMANEQHRPNSRRHQLPAKPPVPKATNLSSATSRPGTQQSPRAQLSSRSAGAPDQVSGGALASVQEVKRILPATLYLCLESVVKALHAESGAIFMPKGDEMVAVVNVSTKLAFPPSLLRHMAANSLTGGVFASGVALHQENHEEASAARDDNERKLKSLLMFPIIGTGGGSRSALKKGLKPGEENRIGVIQVVNKRRGTVRFDAKDENILCSAAFFIAQVMERHDIDWHTNYYDPITLHNLSPFTPSPAAFDLTAKQHSLGEELLKSADNAGIKIPQQHSGSSTGAGAQARVRAPAVSKSSQSLRNPQPLGKSQQVTTKTGSVEHRTQEGRKHNELSSSAKIVGEDEVNAELRMEDCVPKDFIPPRLIHRTTIPVSLHRRNNLKDEATMLDAAPSLLQIDSYLFNLQDCWRKAVQLNAQSAQTDHLRVAQLKRVREELNKQKMLAKSLSEELRLQKLDAGDYLEEYENLKSELQGYLDHAEEHAPLATTADDE